MSDSKEHVRAIAQSMGLEIAGDRVEKLPHAYEQALAEAELVRQEPTAWPEPSPFDAAWSEKR